MATYRIRFHPEVATDLQSIAEIVADYSGAAEAAHKLVQIQEAVFSLAENPESGSTQYNSDMAVKVVPAGRKGIVVFEIDKNTRTVFVLAIGYGGREWVFKIDDRQDNLIPVSDT